MPLNLSIGLPGPFTYSKRLGRTDGRHGATWWLFVGWWWKPLVWLLYALCWSVYAVTVLTVRLVVLCVRVAGGHAQSSHTSGHGPDRTR